jgi:hypothetical protein
MAKKYIESHAGNQKGARPISLASCWAGEDPANAFALVPESKRPRKRHEEALRATDAVVKPPNRRGFSFQISLGKAKKGHSRDRH